MQRLILSVSVLILVVTGCSRDEPEVLDPVETPDDTGGTQQYEEVLYASDQEGKFDIWHKHKESETRITTLEGESWWPRIDGDGQRLLYYYSAVQVTDVNDYSSASLWSMDINGANRKELIPVNAFGWEQHGFANWSPEGDRIVMSALDPQLGTWQIYVTDAEGQNPKRVSLHESSNYFDPVFSPNGSSIACVRQPIDSGEPDESRYEIYLIDLRTSTEIRLTENIYRDHHPDFSGDGSKVVFASLIDPDYLGIGNWSLYEVDVASKRESEVLADETINLFPRYSKDDKSIYFNQVDVNTFRLRVVQLNLQDRSVTYLTSGDFYAMNVDPY